MTIRVLLADDQRVVREGLGTLLGLLDGIELVATAADGEEAVALADHALVVGEHDPDHAGSHSSTRKPSPAGPALSCPPSSSARSRMPVRP